MADGRARKAARLGVPEVVSLFSRLLNGLVLLLVRLRQRDSLSLPLQGVMLRARAGLLTNLDSTYMFLDL